MSSLATRIFANRHAEWMLHLAIWLFIIAERWINHYPAAEHTYLYGLYNTLGLLAGMVLPLYVHTMILLPRYLQKLKWAQYSFLLLALLLFTYVFRGLSTAFYVQLIGYDVDFSAEFMKWAFRDYVSLGKFVVSPTALLLLISFAYRLLKDWFMHERVRAALETENVKMELAYLKSQVDPHFLFNTLNNLYAIALEENAARTADGVAKMGTLMRYNLHDSQADRILLEKEIAYIEKYIELQQLRIPQGAQVQISTEVAVGTLSNEKIAPMLLLPFVENAFKYGISMVEPSAISIVLKLEKGVLQLLVTNTLHPKKGEEQGGIGLKNVQKRLQLLYPERHQLLCQKSAGEYKVALTLTLAA